MSDELSNFSMLELFRLEVDNQAAILNEGLLALEHGNQSAPQLEALMRAAHSVKGAARMVGSDDGVLLAHAMEDSFVAAQSGALQLGDRHVDLLLKAVDQLLAISRNEQDKSELEHLAQRDHAHFEDAGLDVSILQENLLGVQVVRGFAREPYEIEKFHRQSQDVFDRRVNIMRYFFFV